MGKGYDLLGVEFIYGYLFQFDWRDSETGERFRTFCNSKDVFNSVIKYSDNEIIKQEKEMLGE